MNVSGHLVKNGYFCCHTCFLLEVQSFSMDVKIHLPKATLDMSFDVTVEMRGAVTRRNLERLKTEAVVWT